MKALIILLWAVPTVLFADVSFGQLADNIFGPVEVLTQLMLGICYAAGAALTLFGLLQFKAHRQNPKMVPITMPLVLVICGLVMLVLPKVTTQEGWSWAATVQSKQAAQQSGNFSGSNLHRYEPKVQAAPVENTVPQVVQPQPEVAPPVENTQPTPAVPQPAPEQPKVYVDPDEPIK